MKRDEKNALSRQRILEAAMTEFSAKGYAGGSLTTLCAATDISKGIIYHHFKDKDELYLSCVQICFDSLTACMRQTAAALTGPLDQRLRGYFDARFRFFARNPLLFGIFANAVLNPPPHLTGEIAVCRKGFDEGNIQVLTGLLRQEPLRPGLSVSAIVEDFRLYMDYFHMRFREELRESPPSEAMLREHEERCHRQLDILLHGVIDENNGNK